MMPIIVRRIVLVNGVYSITCTVSLDGQCEDTFVQSVYVTGSEEMNASQSFLIYPNPSDGRFTIETNFGNTISIYDLYGRLVGKRRAAAAKEIFSLPQGVYLIDVGERREKLIVR